jgi:hypothetical protein
MVSNMPGRDRMRARGGANPDPGLRTPAGGLLCMDAAAGVVYPSHPGAAMDLVFERAIPILRIFSVEKADEFYLGWLGFTVDWDHRFAPTAPLYRQVSRAGLALHLSEHHGDGSPGVAVCIHTRGIAAFHRELLAKDYRFNRPGLEQQPWGLTFTAIDPSGNRLRFLEKPA